MGFLCPPNCLLNICGYVYRLMLLPALVSLFLQRVTFTAETLNRSKDKEKCMLRAQPQMRHLYHPLQDSGNIPGEGGERAWKSENWRKKCRTLNSVTWSCWTSGSCDYLHTMEPNNILAVWLDSWDPPHRERNGIRGNGRGQQKVTGRWLRLKYIMFAIRKPITLYS